MQTETGKKYEKKRPAFSAAPCGDLPRPATGMAYCFGIRDIPRPVIMRLVQVVFSCFFPVSVCIFGKMWYLNRVSRILSWVGSSVGRASPF